MNRRWPHGGSHACGDTSVPLRVAPSGGRAVSWPATWLEPPCPAQVWCGDIRGHQVGVSVSVVEWGQPPNAVVAPEAHGLIAHPLGLHQGSVTVLVSLSWHMDGQGTGSAGCRQAGDKAGAWLECQWPPPAAAPALLRLFLDMFMHKGFARSCFLLRKNPVGKKTPQNNSQDPSPDTCSPPAVLLDSRNQFVLGCAWLVWVSIPARC